MAAFSTRLEHLGLERYQSLIVFQVQMSLSEDDDTVINVSLQAHDMDLCMLCGRIEYICHFLSILGHLQAR